MSGSIGNLAAVELRRADGRKRDKNGERVINAPKISEEVIDYTDGNFLGAEVTQDGPESMMTQAQRASQEVNRISGALPGEVNGHLDGCLVTPEVRRQRRGDGA